MTVIFGEKMLMKKETEAMIPPDIVMRRQPYLLANALTTGPTMQKQLICFKKWIIY